MKRVWLALGALVSVVVIIVAAYAINILIGMHTVPQTIGTLQIAGLQAPVEILRDNRNVPHIRAQNEHDMFFAEGYAEATDRLFQMDIIRRFVLGDLSEILGKSVLSTDEDARTVPVEAIVKVQMARLTPNGRAMLSAFADGVNAAAAREPTPVEFRLLAYRPEPWRPEDALVVGFATVLELTDTWDDIAKRAASGGNIQLTDPCYEAPVTVGIAHLVPVTAACTVKRDLVGILNSAKDPIGSNEWAAGANHTTTGRALLANDPHLRLGIPGVWYLIDLQSPGYHAAGATFAGTPGVILGHNDDIAWGATNGTVSAMSVFQTPPVIRTWFHFANGWKTEIFHVRFGADVTSKYFRSPEYLGVHPSGNSWLARWSAYSDPHSPLVSFDQLDRARSVSDAIAILRAYPGPTQNFVVADTAGKASYNLAGPVPNDPAWSRYAHNANDLSKMYPPIPFDRLPHVAPSRDAIVWTSNNKMYGPGYPYRLTAQFEPPYRAYRVAELLAARRKYDVAYFTTMQMDTLSLPEHELAQMIGNVVAAHEVKGRASSARSAEAEVLSSWDGQLQPQSKGAALIVAFRKQLRTPIMQSLAYARRGMVPYSGFPVATDDLLDRLLASDPRLETETWGVADATTVRHNLHALGVSFLDGTTFPGNGDEFTVHVQHQGISQSFRAVWDVGNWDAGGITIPQGESGWPGSRYYTDEAAAWENGTLLPLPYSKAAVDKATVESMTLLPSH